MLKCLKIRTLVLAIHGALTLALGLAFLYLRANMTNILFDVIDVGLAILLAVGVFLTAALVDWIAAIGEGIEHFRRFAFYLLSGLGLLLCGVFFTYFPYYTVALLLLFTATHALVFSISAMAFHSSAYASGREYPITHRGVAYAIGAASLLFAIALATLATRKDDLAAIAVLGGYLCFVGARTLIAALTFHHTTLGELRTPKGIASVHSARA